MSLPAIQTHLAALRAGELDTRRFCERVRAEPLPAALAPRYGEVLGDLLDRLESSALFSGDSCSFSQDELLGHVQAWLDKARERVG